MRALLIVGLAGVLAGSAVPMAGPTARLRPSLKDLGFMAGCWRGQSDDGSVIDEYYTPPSENLMLGVSRYTKGGRVTTYEFSTIAVRGDSDLVLTPRPAGQAPADFNLTKLSPGLAVWENPKHDFPQMISYRRLGSDSLAARIEGPGASGTESAEWRMRKVSCTQ